MVIPIDLQLNIDLPPLTQDFDTGVAEFIDFLTRLRRLPGFDVDWWAPQGPNDTRRSIWTHPNDYIERFRTTNAEYDSRPPNAIYDTFDIWAHENNDRLYQFKYTWNNNWDRLLGEMRLSHPVYGTDPQLYLNLIEAAVAWKRPQHLEFGPRVYRRDHHPLSISRVGIGWIGWVPYALTPADVPEAEVVRPLHDGTLIMTQSTFWQPYPTHPNYSRAAIDRAQEVELRLNLLGVLPTGDVLRRGDWGQ